MRPAARRAVERCADALARIIPAALKISPERAYRRAADNFTIDRMIDDYERCYVQARDGLQTAAEVAA